MYGIEHGRCHGRKHNHDKLDETPRETEDGEIFIISFVVERKNMNNERIPNRGDIVPDNCTLYCYK